MAANGEPLDVIALTWHKKETKSQIAIRMFSGLPRW